MFVEVGELVERIAAAAMGVAGSGVEVLELAERGAPADAGTEGGHHVGQGSDGLFSEQGDDGVGGELGWSHCGIITEKIFRNDATLPNRLASRIRRTLFACGETQPDGNMRDRCASTATLQPLLGSYVFADPKSGSGGV